jgi:hypothetical protein
MIGMMAGQIIIEASVLSLILYFVARHEADYSISKVSMVVAGITLGTFLIDTLAAPYIGLFSIVADIAFICFMLMTFCWITLWKSVLVVSIFSCFYIAMFFVVASIKTHLSESMNPSMMEQRTQDLDEIKQELLRQQQMFGGTAQGTPEVIPPTVDVPGPSPDIEPPPPVAEAVAPSPSTPPTDAILPTPMVAATVVSDASSSLPPVAATVSNIVPMAEDPLWREAKKKLKIGGAIKSKNDTWTAFVNNNMVEVGDVVSARHDQMLYLWRVKNIARDGIILDPIESRPLK